MAWVKPRASGNWQGCYRNLAGDERSAGTWPDEKLAYAEALKLENEQRQPGAVDPKDGRIHWGAWFDLWMDSRSLAFSTENGYRSTADNHVLPKWRSVPLNKIEPLEVGRWVRDMERPRRKSDPARSVWTIRNALMMFKASLNAAVREKRLTVSPAEHVAYPDLPEGLERYLTPDEVEGITFYLDGLNALIVWTSVQTGLRFGELAGLHWRRLDLDRGTIQVVEKFDQKACVIDPLPKDNEQRSVPLPGELVEMLTRYRDHAAPKAAKTCGIPHKAGRCIGDLVFRGPRGAAIHSNAWGRGPWSRALKLAGIEGHVRPHDMRHTYASWLLQQGVHLAELARMMGHSDWDVTKKYAHLSQAGFEVVRTALTNHRREARRAADTRSIALSAATPQYDDFAV